MLHPIRVFSIISNTDILDTKNLNIHGNPKQVVIRERSLYSNNSTKMETFFFDTTGCCVKKIQMIYSDSETNILIDKFEYIKGKLSNLYKVKNIGQYSDTTRIEYIYADDGSLKKKSSFHLENGYSKVTNYTTYEIDSIDNKTILVTYYLYIGEKNGNPIFKTHLDRICYNSDNRIEYFSSKGFDYRIHYDSATREKKTYQCIGHDSSIISIQKYDKYGNEIENVSNIYCSNIENLTVISKNSFNDTFINYCIKECELILEKKDFPSKKNTILTFYKYDELKNIELKFVYYVCKGSMYYTTYEYTF